jgi:predicted nuclease with TOPRIM domain
MEHKLLEVVRANLPEQTAGEMRKYIEEAEQVKKDLERSESEYKHSQEVIRKFKEEIAKKNDLIDDLTKIKNEYSRRKKEIKEKEIEVEKREIRQEILKIKAEEAQKRSYDVKELASIVFRNKTLVTKSVETPVVRQTYNQEYDGNGNYVTRATSDYIDRDTQTTEIRTEQE